MAGGPATRGRQRGDYPMHMQARYPWGCRIVAMHRGPRVHRCDQWRGLPRMGLPWIDASGPRVGDQQVAQLGLVDRVQSGLALFLLQLFDALLDGLAIKLGDRIGELVAPGGRFAG